MAITKQMHRNALLQKWMLQQPIIAYARRFSRHVGEMHDSWTCVDFGIDDQGIWSTVMNWRGEIIAIMDFDLLKKKSDLPIDK